MRALRPPCLILCIDSVMTRRWLPPPPAQGKHALAVDEQTDWLPPIGNPSKLGVAFNNRKRRIMMPETTILPYWSKPIIVEKIGRRAKHISEADALDVWLHDS